MSKCYVNLIIFLFSIFTNTKYFELQYNLMLKYNLLDDLILTMKTTKSNTFFFLFLIYQNIYTNPIYDLRIVVKFFEVYNFRTTVFVYFKFKHIYDNNKQQTAIYLCEIIQFVDLSVFMFNIIS